MKRKVIKQGNNTLTITLPRKWTRNHGILGGDEIDIEERENGLILTSDKTMPASKIEINISEMNNPIIWRYFMAAYRAGFNEIVLKFQNPEKIYDIEFASTKDVEKNIKRRTMQMIQDMVNRFIGVEIVEHEPNYCVIKDLSGAYVREDEFNNALRRIFHVITSIADENLTALKNKEKDKIYNIEVVDATIDRFTDFCLRILNKTGHSNFRRTPAFYSIIMLLESIGDEYHRLAKHVSVFEKNSTPVTEHISDLGVLFKQYSELFYKFDERRAINLGENLEKFKKNIVAVYKKLSPDERELLYHIKKIRRTIVDLLQLTIELKIDEGTNLETEQDSTGLKENG